MRNSLEIPQYNGCSCLFCIVTVGTYINFSGEVHCNFFYQKLLDDLLKLSYVKTIERGNIVLFYFRVNSLLCIAISSVKCLLHSQHSNDD